MHRLAVETGGQITKNTNDFSIAYDRAKKTMYCNYALGFEPTRLKEDKPKRIRVYLRNQARGMRAHHADGIVRRSKRRQDRRLVEAAFLSPNTFDTGRVLAHIFPVRPLSGRRWQSMLAVQFPVPIDDELSAKEFGAVLLSGSGTYVVHRSQDVFIPNANAQLKGTTAALNYRESVRLKPGTYDLRVVMKDLGETLPHSAQVKVQVPRVPKGELVLIDPILGRPAGKNATWIKAEDKGKRGRKKRSGERSEDEIARGDRFGGTLSFQPIIDRRIEDAPYLVVLSSICYLGKDGGNLDPETTILRRLFKKDGTLIGELDRVPLDLEGNYLGGENEKLGVRCQQLVDGIPPLPPGEYVFEERIHPAPENDQYGLKELPFSLVENHDANTVTTQ